MYDIEIILDAGSEDYRVELLPLVEDDNDIAIIAEYIRDSIDAVPEEKGY